jgi:hypothetical protein
MNYLLRKTKFIYWKYFPLKVKYIYLPGDRENILVCLDDSYKKKPHVYRHLAEKFDASITTIKASLNPFLYLRAGQIFPKKKFSRLYMWSDTQIPAVLFIKKYLGDFVAYNVFQHGDFPIGGDACVPDIEKEWADTRAKEYYFWRGTENNKLVQNLSYKNKNVSYKFVDPPNEPKRDIVDNIGFGTRGPEFLNEDFPFLSNNSSTKRITIYFHPSYKILHKFWLMARLRKNGFSVRIGHINTVPKIAITMSRSFLKVCKKSGSDSIITDYDKI